MGGLSTSNTRSFQGGATAAPLNGGSLRHPPQDTQPAVASSQQLHNDTYSLHHNNHPRTRRQGHWEQGVQQLQYPATGEHAASASVTQGQGQGQLGQLLPEASSSSVSVSVEDSAVQRRHALDKVKGRVSHWHGHVQLHNGSSKNTQPPTHSQRLKFAGNAQLQDEVGCGSAQHAQHAQHAQQAQQHAASQRHQFNAQLQDEVGPASLRDVRDVVGGKKTLREGVL